MRFRVTVCDVCDPKYKSYEKDFDSMNKVDDYVENVLFKLKDIEGHIEKFDDDNNFVGYDYMYTTRKVLGSL